MNLSMDFTNANVAGDTYKLVCKNESPVPWTFYVYQKLPNQPVDIFSLAWFASPIKIAQGNQITFTWQIDYSFIWGRTGAVVPGVTFEAGGVVPCSIQGANQTTFTTDNNTPMLSPPTSGGQAGSLTIHEGPNVPNLVYSTGIGMSGQGTFVQQALSNVDQIYTPTPKYYIAAGSSVQMGQVLAQQVVQADEVTFPRNVYTMYATLLEDQTWDITQ